MRQNYKASSSLFLSPTTESSDPGDKALLMRISAGQLEIETLSNEKINLTQRLVELLTRTRARLDADLARVRILQGESPNDIRASSFHNPTPHSSTSPYSTRRMDSNPILQLEQNLRSAIAIGSPTAEPGILALTPPSSGTYNKKRRLTTTTSIKLPSPAPVQPLSGSIHPRSRLSRQVTLKDVEESEPDADADAEGEEDIEGEDAEDDSTPYCFCRKQSYGDMIGCDNPNCPYQWFHILCVGVKTPLPDKWYCPDCKKQTASERRKGRKK